MRTVGKVLTTLGIVLLLGACFAGWVAVTGGLKETMRTLQEQTPVSPTADVSLDAGEEYGLFARSDGAAHDAETSGAGLDAGPTPTCTVTDPEGARVALSGGTSSTISRGSSSWRSFAVWTAQDAGSYHVTCSSSLVMAAPALSAESIITGVTGALIAACCGFLGATLLVIGIICWVVGGRRERERAGIR